MCVPLTLGPKMLGSGEPWSAWLFMLSMWGLGERRKEGPVGNLSSFMWEKQHLEEQVLPLHSCSLNNTGRTHSRDDCNQGHYLAFVLFLNSLQKPHSQVVSLSVWNRSLLSSLPLAWSYSDCADISTNTSYTRDVLYNITAFHPCGFFLLCVFLHS